MRAPKVQIVVAWADVAMEWDGRPYARDMGARPGMRAVTIGKACMWLNRGTDGDVEKAKAYAATKPGYRVFVYPTSERDPLGRAKAAVVAAA